MPIKLSPGEIAFIERVLAYCADGLSQPKMADREGVSLTGLRDRLKSCGLEIASITCRDVVRVKTGETFRDLQDRGEVVVEGSHELAAA